MEENYDDYENVPQPTPMPAQFTMPSVKGFKFDTTMVLVVLGGTLAVVMLVWLVMDFNRAKKLATEAVSNASENV